ncbi:MAG TPA: hypothetical protein VNN20_12440 [Thermodesulfobacteriota bacterium]|nr:hypothetical protein [Thermodesulfobacteriota bacterium]
MLGISNLMSWLKLSEKKVRKLAAIAIALALVVFALPTATQAGADVYHYSFKGQTAVAYFYSGDECSFTAAYVFMSDGRIKAKGKPEVQSAAYITVVQYDYCAGTYLYADGYSELAGKDFQINKKLISATVDTTIEVYDYYTGNSFPVNVSINWTGSGDIYSGKYHSHFQGFGYSSNYRSNGSSRYAEASGTVSDGTTNFTPEPSSYAYMDSASYGSVDIYK